MAKDPRFNFYPDNYEGGTDFFTLEQDGAYLRLFILQFREGQFTERQAIQKLMMRCIDCPQKAKDLWGAIKYKFETDGTYYWNARLRVELDKSKKQSEDQADRANKRWGKDSGTNPAYAGAIPEVAYDPAYAFNSNSISNTTTKTNSKKNTAEADVFVFDRRSVISELNGLTGRAFDPDADYFKKNLNARIKQYGLPDLIDMIRFIVYKRKGTDFEQYLKPDTIFRPEKCASYMTDMKHHRDNGLMPKRDTKNGPKSRDEMMEEFRIAQAKKYATQ